MGAAASSEAALRNALATAIHPPTDEKRYLLSSCSVACSCEKARSFESLAAYRTTLGAGKSATCQFGFGKMSSTRWLNPSEKIASTARWDATRPSPPPCRVTTALLQQERAIVLKCASPCAGADR